MKSYTEFLLEKKENDLLELLNEAVFIMAPEMSDIIDELYNSEEGYSKIAKCFYMLDMEDIDTQISYLNLGDDNSTITFLKPEKVDKIRKEKEWTINDVWVNVKGNGIRVGRLTRKVIELYNKSRSVKTTKATNSSISDVKFTDQEIEKFVNAYKSQYDFNNNIMDNFSLVSSEDDIKEAYLEDNYYSGDGTLGGSCMRNDDAQNYLELYHNTSVNLLVLKSANNKIMGRSVIWTLSDGRKFMDRTYTNRDSDVDLFIKYAQENRYIYKAEQDSRAHTYFYEPGDNYNNSSFIQLESKVYEFSIGNNGGEEFPYMDTMKYLYWEEGIIRNYKDKSNYYIKLEDVDGWCDCAECDGEGREECNKCDGDGNNTCEDCRGYGYEECSRCNGYGDNMCKECDGDEEVECEECDGEGYIDGETCGTCGGSSKVTCVTCDGYGTENCSNCDGGGTITEEGSDGEEHDVDCEDCDARGKVDCTECDGNSTIECSDCSGRGERPCYDCQ